MPTITRCARDDGGTAFSPCRSFSPLDADPTRGSYVHHAANTGLRQSRLRLRRTPRADALEEVGAFDVEACDPESARRQIERGVERGRRAHRRRRRRRHDRQGSRARSSGRSTALARRSRRNAEPLRARPRHPDRSRGGGRSRRIRADHHDRRRVRKRPAVPQHELRRRLRRLRAHARTSRALSSATDSPRFIAGFRLLGRVRPFTVELDLDGEREALPERARFRRRRRARASAPVDRKPR